MQRLSQQGVYISSWHFSVWFISIDLIFNPTTNWVVALSLNIKTAQETLKALHEGPDFIPDLMKLWIQTLYKEYLSSQAIPCPVAVLFALVHCIYNWTVLLHSVHAVWPFGRLTMRSAISDQWSSQFLFSSHRWMRCCSSRTFLACQALQYEALAYYKLSGQTWKPDSRLQGRTVHSHR